MTQICHCSSAGQVVFENRVLNIRIITTCVHKFGRWYVQEICRREYESQHIRRTERLVEYRFVLASLFRTAPHTVLDVGTGTTALPHLLNSCGFIVTAIDNIDDYWEGGICNRHFYIIHDNITQTQITKTFELISCVRVLEHIRNHEAAIQCMFSLLGEGASLALTFPYNANRYIQKVYKLPAAGYGENAPYICQVFWRNEVDNWLRKNKGTIVEQEYWQSFSGDLWTCCERLYPMGHVTKQEQHQLCCILVQKDWGCHNGISN